MALIARNNFLFSSPLTFRGGLSLGLMRNNFSQNGYVKNQFAGGYSNFNATPRGYLPPYCWILPVKSGGLSTSAGRMAAALTSGNPVLGRGFPISSSLSASITITDGALGLIVALQAALSASGTITNAEVAASAALVASMSASGTLTDVELGAIVDMVTSLSASGTLTANTLVGVFMEWSVGGPTELSPEGLAQAVWNYLKNKHYS